MKKPLLLPSLNVSHVKLIDPRPPYRFSCQLGNSPGLARKLNLSGQALSLLSLADGTRSTAELFAELQALDPSLQQAVFDELFQQLCAERILVDAADILPDTADDRYSRHLLYYSFFHDRPKVVQEKLSRAVVAIVGMGGIGTWVSYLLAAAGVGTLRLVDGDRIEKSNLTRQVLYTTADVGKYKVEVAKARLAEANAAVRSEVHPYFLENADQVRQTLRGADIVVLSGDKPETLYDDIDAFCMAEGVAWTCGGYQEYTGICGPLLVPGQTGCLLCSDMDREPHDKWQRLPLLDHINGRFQPASFGPMNGMAASLVAQDVLAWVGGFNSPPPSQGNIVYFDTARFTIEKVPMPRRAGCPRCGHLS